MTTLTRLEMPALFRRWLEIPLSVHIVSADELLELGAEFGGDWRRIGDSIIEIAFSNILTDDCKTAYVLLCKTWDMLLARENVI